MLGSYRQFERDLGFTLACPRSAVPTQLHVILWRNHGGPGHVSTGRVQKSDALFLHHLALFGKHVGLL